jgi:TRAP-type mannitol/chloroaromatic compound transport system permease small subunit
MHHLVGIADRIDGFLRRLAHTTGWLFLVAIVIICFDVFTRKIGFQLPYFSSTRLQELEWHVTSTLFLSWLAYGMIKNTHVRIDVFTGHLEQRKKDWIDLFGCVVFALPYCIVLLPFVISYAGKSWSYWEHSDAPNGLPALYIIKSITAFGFATILLATISIMCRKVVDLFGPPSMHSKSGEMEGVEI